MVALGATAGKALLGRSFRVTKDRGTLIPLPAGAVLRHRVQVGPRLPPRTVGRLGTVPAARPTVLPREVYGCRTTLVYPSMRLSNLSYAEGAWSRGRSCETTKLGFARPSMIMSRRNRL